MENIKIDLLFPHPQNPRADVGDVTELAESIKESGIYQNLTVIKGGPGVPEGKEGYTVIIGHRRMAASKLAGLTELPCSVVEMDEKEQIATMLLENMQRTDLTTYEQAQGFQMMLDLGETQQSISKKTGFSAATVRGRLKLLSLDKNAFREAEARGGTLEQYIKISELKDEQRRKHLLSKVGTPDFNWSYNSAVREEKITEKTPGAKAELMRVGTKGRDAWRWDPDYEKVKCCEIEKWEPGVFEIEKDPKETYYWLIFDNRGYILKEVKKKKERKPKKSDKEIAAEQRREALQNIFKQAYENRKTFILNSFTGGRVYESPANEFLYKAVAYSETNTFRYMYLNRSLMREYIGQEDNVYYLNRELIDKSYLNNKVKTIAVLAYSVCNDSERESSAEYYYGDKMPEYWKNKKLEFIYEHLSDLGYEISEEERKLLNGTHELFS